MKILKTLKQLVKIKSYKKCDKIIEFLQKTLKNRVKEVKIIKNKQNDNKSLLVGINTNLKDISPIVLSGHIDTVAPNEKLYDTNPFVLTQKEDKVYGVGVIDMKCFTASVIDCLEEIKKLQTPTVFVLTSDEETELLCVENIVEEMKQLNIKPRFTIVGEPTSMEIKTCANGCYEFEVEVVGKSCHSSIPENGINAISILAKIISFIEEEQKKLNNTTSNAGVVCGGDIVNRVPENAKLKFDIRSTKLEEVEGFISAVEKKIETLEKEYEGSKITLLKTLEIPPLEERGNVNQIVKMMDMETGKFSGACEAGYFQKISGDAVVFGVGDLSLAHKPNEYMVISEYEKYNKKLLELISLIDKKINKLMKNI